MVPADFQCSRYIRDVATTALSSSRCSTCSRTRRPAPSFGARPRRLARSSGSSRKKTRIGDLIRWFAVLGILSGSAKRGYRLAVGELVDVIDAVQRGPLKDGLWRVLRKPTGRAVLVALAHGDRTSSELVMTGERTQVYRRLDTLQVAGVVRDIRVDGKTIYGLLEPGHYSWILGAVELIVAHLAHQTRNRRNRLRAATRLPD
jgi:DNA-binding transcriptional ArsR family regulator